ncbi:MAG TPA: hypothetical protein VN426_09220 [Syntrophomonadaceae bacterium]|nr:hypothetical protein [Syntrophomonadaceae bacterium]
MKYNQKAILCLFFVVAFMFSVLEPLVTDNRVLAAVDVSSKVVLLGQPFKQQPFARNVWDMQVFNGKIYLGSGNYLNGGPSVSPGPIPIMYYDPQTNKFVTEYTVDEEQIDVYKIIDGKLTIPGTDATDSWDFGNYYVLENAKWQKIRTIPVCSHVFDMASYNGKLYAAINGESSANIAFTASSNKGKTWTSQMSASSGSPFFGSRGMTLFEFRGKLYGVGLQYLGFNSTASHINVLVMDGNQSVIQKMPNLLPGAQKYSLLRIFRPYTVNNNLVYLGVFDNIDGSQWKPYGLYVASDLNQPRRIVLPQGEALPADILVRGSTTYVMAFCGSVENGYTNIVYKSENLNQWTELFRFKCDTFPRSFEELNGDFYFGLGTLAYPLKASAGSILKVPKDSYK